MKRKKFWQNKKLSELNRDEWEALCDGCGLCCVHKLDEGKNMAFTNIACHMLDSKTGQCKNYPMRKSIVPDCVQLTKKNVHQIDWLPPTCAYRLRADNKPLPFWHYLVSGDRDMVHRLGISVRHKIISEKDIAKPLWLAMKEEQYLLFRDKKRKITLLKKIFG